MIDLKASNTWAREIRGMRSIANALTFRDARVSTICLFWTGYKNDMRVLPCLICCDSCPSRGGRTLRRISAASNTCSREAMVAPAAVYCWRTKLGVVHGSRHSVKHLVEKLGVCSCNYVSVVSESLDRRAKTRPHSSLQGL